MDSARPLIPRACRGAPSTHSSSARNSLASAIALGIIAALGSVSDAAGAKSSQDDFGITTLSNRPDRISGGDVLVQITYKHDNKNHPLQITLNGYDVSAAFRPGNDPNTLIGLVTGLVIGKNELRVQGNGSSGIKDQTLVITMGVHTAVELARVVAEKSRVRDDF